jgi:hypothetical protein
MLDGKLPQKLTLGSRFNVLVGYEMVGDKGNPRHVIKLFGTRLAEPLNGNGRREKSTLTSMSSPGSNLSKPAWAARIFSVIVIPMIATFVAGHLARIFHESLAATTDMAVLPGVLGCRPLRRTVQVRLGTKVRLGTNTLWLPGGTPIFAVSRQKFMKYPG